MKKTLRSLRELVIVKDRLNNVSLTSSSHQRRGQETTSNENHPTSLFRRTAPKKEPPRTNEWTTVKKLLADEFFEKLSLGLVKPVISREQYSLVTAVATYPKCATNEITQVELDRAHKIVKHIKFGVRNKQIAYTGAKIPAAYRVNGNPGTKR